MFISSFHQQRFPSTEKNIVARKIKREIKHGTKILRAWATLLLLLLADAAPLRLATRSRD